MKAKRGGACKRKNGQDPMQKAVGSVWKQLLGCKAITDGSDFFEMGGDSILALNMLFDVGDRLGVEIPPGLLFENPQFGNFCTALRGISTE